MGAPAGFLSGMTIGTLHVVATPLGNLEDLSPRAARVLRSASVIAAEDTRRTRRLLAAIDAHPDSLLSYHAHSRPSRTTQLLDVLRAGGDVALVSDAGAPGISDPGGELVALARQMGAVVVPIPGPSAVSTALQAAGLPADRYLFLGFLPRKGSIRRQRLGELAGSPWTVVFFEAAPRLAATLNELADLLLPDRRVVVAREMTKVHEEFRVGGASELARHYHENPARGEVTVVVAGADSPEVIESHPDGEELHQIIAAMLATGESRREIARRLSREHGIPRNTAYRLVTEQPDATA